LNSIKIQPFILILKGVFAFFFLSMIGLPSIYLTLCLFLFTILTPSSHQMGVLLQTPCLASLSLASPSKHQWLFGRNWSDSLKESLFKLTFVG